MGFDHHVAIFEGTFADDLTAIDLDFLDISNLWDTELFSDLRTYLSGIAVDSLTAAHNDIFFFNADFLNSSGEDLGSCEGIGAAEFTAGNEDSFISAHCEQFAEHFCRWGGTHGNDDDLCAIVILELESGFDRIFIIWVNNSCHRSTVEGAVWVHRDLA